jgi:hypothetical protein
MSESTSVYTSNGMEICKTHSENDMDLAAVRVAAVQITPRGHLRWRVRALPESARHAARLQLVRGVQCRTEVPVRQSRGMPRGYI